MHAAASRPRTRPRPQASPPAARIRSGLLAAVLALVPVALLSASVSIGGAGRSVASVALWAPPPDTIVRITGNAADGFGVFFYDGRALFPPTRSEAVAECGEHDTAVARARCVAEVRTWYRDLVATRKAMRYARISARGGAP